MILRFGKGNTRYTDFQDGKPRYDDVCRSIYEILAGLYVLLVFTTKNGNKFGDVF